MIFVGNSISYEFCAFGYFEKLWHDYYVKKAWHFLKVPETSCLGRPLRGLPRLDVSGTLIIFLLFFTLFFYVYPAFWKGHAPPKRIWSLVWPFRPSGFQRLDGHRYFSYWLLKAHETFFAYRVWNIPLVIRSCEGRCEKKKIEIFDWD